MKPCELVTTITAIACTISKCYSDEEIALMAAAFTQLGDTLTTILAQNEVCKENEEN